MTYIQLFELKICIILDNFLILFIFQIVCSIIIFTLNKKLKDLIPSNLYKYFIDLKCHLFFPRLPLTNIKQELNLTIVTKNLFNLRPAKM